MADALLIEEAPQGLSVGPGVGADLLRGTDDPVCGGYQSRGNPSV